MVFLVRLTFIIFLSLVPSQAIIIEGNDNLDEAVKTGNTYKNTIQAGKIIVKVNDTIVNYCTGIPIGNPGISETSTIVSCGHIYSDIVKEFGGYQFNFYKAQFYYESYNGTMILIDLIRTPYLASPTVANDFAVYSLTTPTSCNPKLRIAEMPVEKTTLSCLTYGLVFNPTNPDLPLIDNTDRKQCYTVTGAFEASNVGTSQEPVTIYTQTFSANRLATITTTLKKTRSIYIAEPNSPPQLFDLDSGSPWFDGDTLYAITSGTSTINPSDFLETHRKKLSQTTYTWLEKTMTLELHELTTYRKFYNQLTPLYPEVIYPYIT